MSPIPLAFLIVSCFVTSISINDLPQCIVNLIYRNEAKFAYQINLFGPNGSTGSNSDLLEAVFLAKDPRITVNLVPYGELRDFNHRQLVIWIVNTMQSFEEGFKGVMEKNVEFRGHFVLVLRGDFIWQAILHHFWEIGVTNVIMFVEEGSEGGVSVVGYEPFQEDCCRCVGPKVIGRCVAGVCDEGVFEALFDNYVRKLHGCPLRIATFTRLPFIEVVEDRKRRLVLRGVEGDMLTIISRRMNFSIQVRVPTGEDIWGHVYPNGSRTGAVGMVLDNKVDGTIGGFIPYPLLIQRNSASIAYYMTDFVFVVPEELAKMSSLSQFSKPLGTWIWIGMAVVVGTAYLVILIFSCPLVGYFNHSPALTLYRTTIGDSLPSLPTGNFFRFLMFMLLYFNLIIRESYKCSMVSHLTEKRHLVDISTLQAMIDEGYRFAITYPLYDLLFKDTLKLDGTVILLKDEEYSRGLVQIIRERRRIALISIPEEIVDFNHQHPKWVNFRVCGESLMRFHFSVYFRRSSPMVPEFNRLIQRMLSGGMIAKWHSSLMNRRYQTTTLNNEPPTVLTNGHLFSGYIFWAVGLGVAALVFSLEVVSIRSERIRKFLDQL
uniref:ionotropic receptor 7a precursor n=1 Tax=Aedes aegypti TaxID=7159 RepID=UPI000C28719A|nr:ionotropic receptor 7a precursor [Aedes aegypti]